MVKYLYYIDKIVIFNFNLYTAAIFLGRTLRRPTMLGTLDKLKNTNASHYNIYITETFL